MKQQTTYKKAFIAILVLSAISALVAFTNGNYGDNKPKENSISIVYHSPDEVM